LEGAEKKARRDARSNAGTAADRLEVALPLSYEANSAAGNETRRPVFFTVGEWQSHFQPVISFLPGETRVRKQAAEILFPALPIEAAGTKPLWTEDAHTYTFGRYQQMQTLSRARLAAPHSKEFRKHYPRRLFAARE